MRSLLLLPVVLLIGVLPGSGEELAGTYVGYLSYYKQPTVRAELTLTVSGRKNQRVTGVLTIKSPEDRSPAWTSSMRFKGGPDGDGFYSRNLGKWQPPIPAGYNYDVNSLSARFERGLLEGENGPGYCHFTMGRVGTSAATLALDRFKLREDSRKREEYLANTPPERRERPSQFYHGGPSFEYYDARMSAQGWKDTETDPIDAASASFDRRNMKCLSTTEVAWNGQRGIAPIRHFGTRSYVIECDGDCAGMRYQVGDSNDIVTHLGLTMPVPAFVIKSAFFGSADLRFFFKLRDGAGETPKVFVHEWTDQAGDTGPGCQLYRSRH